MATFNSYPHGHFCWIDLMSKDMSSASAFYTGLFGWEIDQQQTQGGPPYAIFTKQGQSLCGLGEMNSDMKSSGMPPVWNSYISVESVEAAVARTVELGGTLAMPVMPVVDAGQMAIIQDPTGAFVSLWQPNQHHGAQLANVPGTWCWNELMTRDPATAQTFYADLFGWECQKEEGSPKNYWIIHNQGRMNGGMLEITPQMGQIPPCWSVYFNVADLNGTMESLKAAGGTVCMKPVESAVGPIVFVTDAQGAAFNLIQMTVPPDD